ncbi:MULTISPECIES: DUF433 domain-containing protein [unclassified Microcoleus]
MQRITFAPNIAHVKHCIRGLRYPLKLIIELLISGMNVT